MERTLDLQYDEIVIGADLSALLYAYKKKIPIIFTRHKKPYYYDNEEGFENITELWNSVLFTLAYASLSPFSDKVHMIRIEDWNTLKVSTKQNFLVNIKFDKLVISDDYNVEGLPQISGKTTYNNSVMDFMAISYRPDSFWPVRRFIKEDGPLCDIRVTKNYDPTGKRTLVLCKSILTDEQLKEEEFSERYMRLRFIREMSPKITSAIHIKREVSILGKNLYKFPSNIKMLTEKPEEIMDLEEAKNVYFSMVESKLWKK